ncbi:MAG: YihY/virulence factor BrkB family protein [Balneolaceae bacterium]
MNKTKTISSPLDIGFSGWKKILLRLFSRLMDNLIYIVSAGVAFYAFIAIFPAIIALISIYGLAVDPQMAQEQIQNLAGMMPQEAFSIIETQIQNLVSTTSSALGWGTILGILISLWFANNGTKSIFTGLDFAYDTVSERSFIKHNAMTLLFTFCGIILLIISMGFIVIFPALVQVMGLPENIETLISWLRWPLLALLVVTAICWIYKYAPDRETPKFRWVVLGAIIATILWLLASWGFSYYVSNFANYGEMYGSIAAVVILMFWLFISSLTLLLGGELNSAAEAYAQNELE